MRATLAGHVHVEDYAIIGGLNRYSSILPYRRSLHDRRSIRSCQRYSSLYHGSGNHAKLFGLNLIGLKRRNFSEKTIKAIKEAYRIIFRSNLLLKEAIKKAEAEVEDFPEVNHFIKFIKESERGVCR